MKQGWEIKKLGEICNKITNIKWNEIDKTTSFPYIDLSAVDRENSSIHDYEYINISNAPSRAKQIVKVGDILFATTRPMLKRACIIPNEFNNAIASTGFCVLRPQGTVLSEWIYHNIKSNRFYKYIEPIQKGVSYPAVTDNEVKDFCIPVPPREEQERIVAELDCLSGVIEKKREQLKQLDALAQSIFYQMFGDPITNEKGWEVKKLGEVCVFQQGVQVPIEEQFEERQEGMNRFLRIVDFTQGNEKPRYVHINSEKHILKEGEIAIVRYGSPGFVCYGKYGVIANNLFKIIPLYNSLSYVYFIHWLKSEAFQSIVSENQYGAALQAIKFSTIKDIATILPPLALQQEYAEKIEAIERQKELIKQSITQTEELFNSRMDYYFN